MDMEAKKRLLACVNEWEAALRASDLKGKDRARNILQGTCDEDIAGYNVMAAIAGETPEAIRTMFLNGAMTEEELAVFNELKVFARQNWGQR